VVVDEQLSGGQVQLEVETERALGLGHHRLQGSYPSMSWRPAGTGQNIGVSTNVSDDRRTADESRPTLGAGSAVIVDRIAALWNFHVHIPATSADDLVRYLEGANV
jgi:hypothetical protein